MNDDIVTFFYKSTHASPAVIAALVTDIDNVTRTFSLTRKVSPWGGTEQRKMCIYGGLTLSVRQEEDSNKKDGSTKKYIVPVQIWLSGQYPIEPPIIYLIAGAVPTEGNGKESIDVKILSNHPNVDLNGLCYCKYISEWKPRTSTLKKAVGELLRELEACGVCPLIKNQQKKACNMNASASVTDTDCVICYNKKDTVLVPCGHYCLCSSCAANVLDCPICRVKVKVRQRIFS